MARLLVVDDEQSIREFFEILLAREGYNVDVVSGGREAIDRISDQIYDLVITDLAMPGVDGMAVLDRVKEVSPETLVLMITAYATAESAVEAMKRGAYDYLMKPFKVDEIRLVIQKALETRRLRDENAKLKTRLKGGREFLGVSEKMKQVFDRIDRIAAGRSSVLILGESGTGKELVARAIHEKSPRSGKPYVSINCAAIPESLIESELFGYLKGAFTGAMTNKMGLFEAAHQGTLFLDEIGELPAAVQVKLLRVLQERVLRRVGSTTSTPVDVRIVCATNRNLEADVQTGRFREDLFYRLNVIQIQVPSLRDRPEDIPILAKHFLERYSAEHGKKITEIAPDALERLMAYPFPGNVRELENMIEQSVAFETSGVVRLESLPEKIRGEIKGGLEVVRSLPREGVDLERTIHRYEKALIVEALAATGGVRKRAAELLKISFRSLRYRLLKHGLASKEEAEDE
ncbi:MAG: sigma-54 dependent transcriptional regulator [Pseudomonadota bacterium]